MQSIATGRLAKASISFAQIRYSQLVHKRQEGLFCTQLPRQARQGWTRQSKVKLSSKQASINYLRYYQHRLSYDAASRSLGEVSLQTLCIHLSMVDKQQSVIEQHRYCTTVPQTGNTTCYCPTRTVDYVQYIIAIILPKHLSTPRRLASTVFVPTPGDLICIGSLLRNKRHYSTKVACHYSVTDLSCAVIRLSPLA